MTELTLPTSVSVVIPAYNARATIDETLRSVRAQTHRDLEIIVVDDGSTDATGDIVGRHVQQDQRIRLIRQRNAGVAVARNAGAAAARGAFLAPVDADDLWHPRKIEQQLAVFADGPADLGLVYTWFALIDAQSNVIHTRHGPPYAGYVLPILARYNFIGNGSSPLIRMATFRQSPQYDPSLRARGAQGCEDWKLYCQLAGATRFGVVQAHLTAYRRMADNMSSDALQMMRSRDLAIGDILAEHPELRDQLHHGRNRIARYLLHRAIRQGRFNDAQQLIRSMARHDGLFALRSLAFVPGYSAETLREKIGWEQRRGQPRPYALFPEPQLVRTSS